MRASVFAICFALGCSTSSGSTDAVDAGSDTTSITYGSSTCGTCTATACSAQVSACSSDPSCAAYLSCVNGCPLAAEGNFDAACESRCPAVTASVGEDAKSKVVACRASAKCPTCGTTPDAGTHPILNQACSASMNPDACQRCLDESCCEVRAQYKADPAAVKVRECMAGCTGAGYRECYTTCIEADRAGAAKFLRLFACTLHFCNTKVTCDDRDPTACGRCTGDKCAAPEVDCFADVDCYRLSLCMGGCGTDAVCIEGCRSKSTATGVSLLDRWTTCGASACKAECG